MNYAPSLEQDFLNAPPVYAQQPAPQPVPAPAPQVMTPRFYDGKPFEEAPFNIGSYAHLSSIKISSLAYRCINRAGLAGVATPPQLHLAVSSVLTRLVLGVQEVFLPGHSLQSSLSRNILEVLPDVLENLPLPITIATAGGPRYADASADFVQWRAAAQESLVNLVGNAVSIVVNGAGAEPVMAVFTGQPVAAAPVAVPVAPVAAVPVAPAAHAPIAPEPLNTATPLPNLHESRDVNPSGVHSMVTTETSDSDSAIAEARERLDAAKAESGEAVEDAKPARKTAARKPSTRKPAARKTAAKSEETTETASVTGEHTAEPVAAEPAIAAPAAEPNVAPVAAPEPVVAAPVVAPEPVATAPVAAPTGYEMQHLAAHRQRAADRALQFGHPRLTEMPTTVNQNAIY